MDNVWTFGGGLMVGFASSLHCIGMCGGIALMLGRSTSSQSGHRIAQVLPLHVGRIGAYMVMGGITGSMGALALAGLGGTAGHLLLRWAGAMTLAWIGLSMLGVMPTPAVVGRFMLSHAPAMGHVRALNTPPKVRGLAAGFGWGLMPCGMVYGALLYAAFSGSVFGGMSVMAGFGLGTLPALLLVHSGYAGLAALARRPALRAVAALLILLAAALSLMADEASLLALCRLD
jgi:sulfite exporter TauE/SafE